MSKKLMILGASILQVPAIIKAKEMGLDVIVVDMNPKAIGFDIPGVKKEIISTIDSCAIVEAAKKYQIRQQNVYIAVAQLNFLKKKTIVIKLIQLRILKKWKRRMKKSY